MFDATEVIYVDNVDVPPFHFFIEIHCDTLATACGVLMGAAGETLVRSLVERLSREPVPSRSTWRLVSQIPSLLTLRFVQQVNRQALDKIAADDPIWAELLQLANDMHAAIAATNDEIKINRRPCVEHRRPRHSKAGKLSEKTDSGCFGTAPSERTIPSVSEANR